VWQEDIEVPRRTKPAVQPRRLKIARAADVPRSSDPKPPCRPANALPLGRERYDILATLQHQLAARRV